MTHIIQTVRDFWTYLAVGQIQQLGAWNYVLLAILVMIEGPLATLFGAATAASGLLHPGLVFMAAALGNLFADTLWYTLGYVGKTNWIVRYGRWLGVKPEHVVRLEQDMKAHAPKVILIAKLTWSFSIPALIAAGMTRTAWRRSFSAIILAECLWTGTLVLVGYHFSQWLPHMEQKLQIIAVVGALLFLLLIVRYIKKRYGLIAHNAPNDDDNDHLSPPQHTMNMTERRALDNAYRHSRADLPPRS